MPHSMSSKRKAADTGLRWCKKSKANQMLLTGLKKQEIDPNTPPKQVWESEPEFQKCKLDAFRAAYNRAKADYGFHVRPSEGEFRGAVAAHFYVEMCE